MTTKNLIKNFFAKNGGSFISVEETRVYQNGTIVYNSGKGGMKIEFSSIDDNNRKYIINNLNGINMALRVIITDYFDDCFDYIFHYHHLNRGSL